MNQIKLFSNAVILMHQARKQEFYLQNSIPRYNSLFRYKSIPRYSRYFKSGTHITISLKRLFQKWLVCSNWTLVFHSTWTAEFFNQLIIIKLNQLSNSIFLKEQGYFTLFDPRAYQ